MYPRRGGGWGGRGWGGGWGGRGWGGGWGGGYGRGWGGYRGGWGGWGGPGCWYVLVLLGLFALGGAIAVGSAVHLI